MKRLVLLRLVLLSSLLTTALWAVAQYDSQPSQSSSGMSKTTLEGCLSGSDGSYSLTDNSGTTYQLTGDTAKLQNHVGHTIKVTGTSASDSTMRGKQSGSMSAPSDTEPTFSVTSFKHVSSTCNSAH
jgi:hypothetical protein